MIEDIENILRLLNNSDSDLKKIEFFELLHIVYNNPYLDGSLRSEIELFKILKDIDLTQKIIEKREELSYGLKFFKEEKTEEYLFEREESRKKLVSLGYLENNCGLLDIKSNIITRFISKEVIPINLVSETYETIDSIVYKLKSNADSTKKKTPSIFKSFFGENYEWTHIELKVYKKLRESKESILLVVPPGFNALSIAIIASKSEKLIYIVGNKKLFRGWDCGNIKEIEKKTKNKEGFCIIFSDVWSLIENEEQLLMKMLTKNIRVIGFTYNISNIREVASFLRVKEVLVFDKQVIDTEYIFLKDGLSNTPKEIELRKDKKSVECSEGKEYKVELDRKLNEKMWQKCTELEKPILIITSTYEEAISCARLIFRHVLDNEPLKLDHNEHPKEIQNFLMHRISLNEYFSKNCDFHIIEKNKDLSRKAKSIILRQTLGMTYKEVCDIITNHSLIKGVLITKKVVIIAEKSSIDRYIKPNCLQSNLLNRIHEALNLELLEGLKTFKECISWFGRTFLSRSIHVDIKSVLINLQRRNLIFYEKSFTCTKKGSIMANYNISIKEVDILYSVEKFLTEYKLFNLLSQIHPFKQDGEVPIPTEKGKMLQFLIIKPNILESKALKLLSILFDVCLDLKFSAAKLVHKYYKSIENKCFACLSGPFKSKILDFKVSNYSFKATDSGLIVSIKIESKRFNKIHTFLSDVMDVNLFGYKLVTVSSASIDFTVPVRRFYNLSMILDNEFWSEYKICLETDKKILLDSHGT